MNRKIRHIAMMILLLIAGAQNGAWAKVTYKILTLPITTYKLGDSDTKKSEFTGSLVKLRDEVRVEALQHVSNSNIVYLPDEVRSPLAHEYKYWTTATKKTESSTTWLRLYGYSSTTYELYEQTLENEVTEGTTVANNSVIYVTYKYNTDNGILDLTGDTLYNVMMQDKDGKQRFLAFNMGWGNRSTTYYVNDLKTEGLDNLIKDDSIRLKKVKDKADDKKWNGRGALFNFTYKFDNESLKGFDPNSNTYPDGITANPDPYNIRIGTGYTGDATYSETDKALGKAVWKYYKGGTMFWKKGSEYTSWLSSDDDIQWQKNGSETTPAPLYVPGYYRGTGNGGNPHSEMDPIGNSFVLLNHASGDGYTLAITKYSSNSTTNYGINNNLTFWKSDDSKTTAKSYSISSKDIDKVFLYRIKTYTFHVKTPSGDLTATRKWSSFTVALDEVIDAKYVPESLKRKYCEIEGFYNNEDLADNHKITTFGEATNNHIYIKYKVSDNIPFKAITAGSDTTWYELTDAGSVQTAGKKIKWDGSVAFKNNGANAEYTKNAMFAFVGDPYELKIIHRQSRWDNNADRYVGSSSTNLGVSATATDGYIWDIPYDDTDGSFLLRQYNTSDTYWQWNAASTDQTITKSTTSSTRVKVMSLPLYTYYYNIVDTHGKIAVKASKKQPIYSNIRTDSIPEIIRSPFLSGETVTFFSTLSEEGNRLNLSGQIIEAPSTDNAPIYVSYTTSALGSKSITLGGTQEFYVKVNGEYIYYDTTIKSKSSPTSTDLENSNFIWILSGSDPYAMNIKNKGSNNFVNVSSWGDGQELNFNALGSNFIAKSSTTAGFYEVMAATGSGDDASTTYYNIGLPSSNTVKMYGNSSYAHGSAVIRFQLEGSITYTYKLVDKASHVLLTAETKNPDLVLPAELQSPLVGEYHYWAASNMSHSDTNSDGIDEYTVTDTKTPITSATAVNNDGTEKNTIYVTYTINDLVSYNDVGSPYLLKFANTTNEYFLEDGGDKLTSTKKKPLYVYSNGDSNLNLYDQDLYEEQMAGGSSTRTRWAWFLDSEKKDPYHVKFYSKQATSYQGNSHHLYLRTFAVKFNQDANTFHIVTGANLPAITDKPATEYMILGTEAHNYKMVTTEEISEGSTNSVASLGKRQTVTSFEQYWKTYNMIKQCVLEIDVKNDADYKDADSTDPETFVVPTELRDDIVAKLNAKEKELGDKWHSYNAFAYATRWNGYDDAHQHTKKAYETLEHWFQTIEMGDGTFDIKEADIDPVMVLLDQHGWEIMRKPLPIGVSEDEKTVMNEAIRPYNSPMVKEYRFWAKANKASGCHKYFKLQNQVSVSGTAYTSTDLTKLPSITAKNVTDSYGAVQDLFVTYVVKDEYADSYKYSLEVDTTKATDGTITGMTIKSESIKPSKFIIRQGNQYVSDEGSDAIPDAHTMPTGGMSKMIVERKGDGDVSLGETSIDDKYLWYIKPNYSIDKEMGISDLYSSTYGSSGEVKTEIETLADYESDSNKSNGFDPYNVQIKNAATGKFFTSNTSGATLSGGAIAGTGSTTVTLEDSVQLASPKFNNFEYYDHTYPKVTNQTFMVVQDANGNMQLMPRFDHTVRVNNFATLADPATASADDQTGTQTTFMVRPLVYEYHIIDNKGREALRYKTGGDYYPDIPSHFQSPQAGDYKYYQNLTNNNGIYEEIPNKTDISAKEITGSFAASGLTDNTNTVYVRYSHNAANDNYHTYTLEGAWYTLQLNSNTDFIIYNGGIKLGSGKPTTGSALNGAKQWQWKFRQTPYTDIDPYAVEIYNRSQKDKPMSAAAYNNSAVSAQTIGADGYRYQRFALLSHTSSGYAFAVAGTGSASDYYFLQGIGTDGNAISTTNAATVCKETGFDSYTGTFTDTRSQVLLTDEIAPSYTYHVYTGIYKGGSGAYNGKKAIEANQDNSTAAGNNYVPILPEAAQTPLFTTDDYIYFENQADTTDVSKKIGTLYGLYDDVVYVRYGAYDPSDENYLVPNKRNDVSSGDVAVHAESNPSPIDISGTLLYNIIWNPDNMMQSTNSTDITNTPNKTLDGGDAYVWKLEGNDPYAIKIKHKGGYYVNGTSSLNATAMDFMLLMKDDYDYGILQKTGGSEKLSDYGQTTVTDDPTKFIIFALSTNKVKYHLVIDTIGHTVQIPYREGTTAKDADWKSEEVKTITGSTARYLNGNYLIGDEDGGQVSLGATFEAKDITRPNCKYYYYIEGIYTDAECTDEIKDLNKKFKGLKLTKMPSDPDLIGKTIKVNVTYEFDTTLTGSNKGGKFVSSISDNYWYTFDTKVSGSDVYLAQYTNAWGLKCLKGRASRYTNDYLWTPVGDPYGFVMYNRYMCKNSNDSTAVMTTATLDEGKRLFLATPGKEAKSPDGSGNVTPTKLNEIYELLESPNIGYFYVHPVANYTGTKLYIKRDDSNENFTKLSSTPAEWTFGLDITQLKPYFDRKGYVGGLTQTAYDTVDPDDSSKKLVTAIKSGSLTYDQLVATQVLVYNDDNIVKYKKGYYRLHSQPDLPNVSTPRYASGYLHETEKTAELGGIPMHFYSREGVTTIFNGADDSNALIDGFTESPATRGELPVLATENDPSTIFYFSGPGASEDGFKASKDSWGFPKSTMQTQGLYAYQNNNQRMCMTSTSGDATSFSIMDIGGATLLIHDSRVPDSRCYMCFDQTETDSIYDLKFKHDTPTDEAKWCMVPADTLGLVLPLNNGGDGHYYATFCAPFDVLLPTDNDKAYICTEWKTDVIYPKPVGDVNASPYAGNDKFVPAGTPVIIRSANSADIKLTIPTTAPTSALSSCVFTGKYLEQKLTGEVKDDSEKVYAFGLPITGIDMIKTSGSTNGDITGVINMHKESTGVGFYVNATPNKEANALESMWTRNNRYVLHNKIYYRSGSSGASAPSMDRNVEFVPVKFDFDEDEEISIKPVEILADKVYDLSGRCVASGDEVINGTWRNRVAPGIYIIGGKKIVVRKY